MGSIDLAKFVEKSLQEQQQQLFDWISFPDRLDMEEQDIDALLVFTIEDPASELLTRAVIAAKYPSLQTLQNLILQGIADGEEMQPLLSCLLASAFNSRSNNIVSDRKYIEAYLQSQRKKFETLCDSSNFEELRTFKLLNENDYIFLTWYGQYISITQKFFMKLIEGYAERDKVGIIKNALSSFTNFLDDWNKNDWIDSLLNWDLAYKRIVAHPVAAIAKNLEFDDGKSGVNSQLKSLLEKEMHPSIIDSMVEIAESFEQDGEKQYFIDEFLIKKLQNAKKYLTPIPVNFGINPRIIVIDAMNKSNGSSAEMQGALRRSIAILARTLGDDDVKENYIKLVFPPSLEEMQFNDEYCFECLRYARGEILKFAASMKTDEAKLLFAEQALTDYSVARPLYREKLTNFVIVIEKMLGDDAKLLLAKKIENLGEVDRKTFAELQANKAVLQARYAEDYEIKSTPENLRTASAIPLPESSEMAQKAERALTSNDADLRSAVISQFWDRLNNPLPIHDKIKQIYLAIEQVHHYREQRSSDQREYQSIYTRHSLFGGVRWLVGASSRTQKLAAADWLEQLISNRKFGTLDPFSKRALKNGELGKVYESCQRAGLC